MFETDALYQNDPKWKNVKLGHDNKETIGTWGCLLTSMTMVANGFGFNETPQSLNEKMKQAGGFQGALVIPATLPSACPGLIYKGYQPCEDLPAPVAQIDAALAAGMPVIAQVDWSPKAGVQTHWIVIYDKENGRYLMKDPYRYQGDSPTKKLYLTDRYKHSGKDPRHAITGVVWFESSAGHGAKNTTPVTPPQPKAKVPVPQDTFFVYGTADSLAFRNDPSISGALIERLPLRVKLTSLESKALGKQKVGVTGQWLHVQTPEGKQGYIAAWYVSFNEKVEDEEVKPAEPTTGDKSLVVKPTTDGVAFRTQPTTAGNTLIKRLPLNTTLVVQEPADLAKKKLGVVGQWIKVKDVANKVGYVAAWYVTRSDKPALGVREQTEGVKSDVDTNDEVILRTTTEGVALRSQPSVGPNTLIKRMPLASELIIMEEGGEKKIGVVNQWLRVQDIEDDEGYVAAWYVKRR